MKSTFFVAALALLSGFANAEFRDFTQEGTGKTISGEIRGVNPAAGTVTLGLETGNVVTFKQSLLVEADREFIKTWAKENAFATAVRMSATKVTGERTTSGGDIYQYKNLTNGYRVNVRNGSTTERLDDLTVNYVLVIERGGGKLELKSGSQSVSGLAPNGASDFETEQVQLSVDMKSVSSCPKCVQAASEFKGDDLLGIMLTVESNGKKGAEVVIPSSRDKKIREAVNGNAN
ncbi:MAG: hypothetical protein ACKO2G_05005 [Verrucomicrobiales bacterium]